MHLIGWTRRSNHTWGNAHLLPETTSSTDRNSLIHQSSSPSHRLVHSVNKLNKLTSGDVSSLVPRDSPTELCVDTSKPPPHSIIQRDPSNTRPQPSFRSPILGIRLFVSEAILGLLLSLGQNSFRQSNYSATIWSALEMVRWNTTRRSPRNGSMPRRRITNTQNYLVRGTPKYPACPIIHSDDTTARP